MTRLRPRFSVRTLAIFVTLVCAYFGAWEATKRYAVQIPPGRGIYRIDLERLVPNEDEDNLSTLGELLEKKIGIFSVIEVWAPGPLVMVQDQIVWDEKLDDRAHRRRVYYLWLFGPKIKLYSKHTGYAFHSSSAFDDKGQRYHHLQTHG